MIEKVYTEEMENFSKIMLLLKEDALIGERNSNTNLLYKYTNKMADLFTLIFGTFFLVLEMIYLKIKNNEPFIVERRVKSIKRQRFELIWGLTLLMFVIGLSTFSILWGVILIISLFICAILPVVLLEVIKKVYLVNYERIRNKKQPFNQIQNIKAFEIKNQSFFWLNFIDIYMKLHNLKSTNSKLILLENIFTYEGKNLVRQSLNNVKSKYVLFLPNNSILLLLDFSQINTNNNNDYLAVVEEIKETISMLEKKNTDCSRMFRIVDSIIEDRVKALIHSMSLKDILKDKSVNKNEKSSRKKL